MDLRAATAMAGQIPNVAAFCREQGISRETFNKWRRRFKADGIEGLADRSRRPRSAPGQTPAAVEEVVLRRRKELADGGADCGPQSIQWSLQRGTELSTDQIPSRTTIWRILKRHGMIVDQPRKRPKSSLRRFVYARPNECWQSDWTSWHLRDGTKVAIAGTLDDHSRYVPGLLADAGDGTAELTWATMTSAIGECGIPAMSLTDNGYVYTGRRHRFVAAFEANLRALGVRTINSSPYHPQTCGKIERFWQTLKRWLDAREDPPQTVQELNELLDEFRHYYNHQRPHRSLGGHTPAEAFAATPKARPAARPIPAPVEHLRKSVDTTGRVLVSPFNVHVGRQWCGHVVDIIKDGNHIAIFSGNRLVRELTADPSRIDQPAAHPYGPRKPAEPNPGRHTRSVSDDTS
ncbi:IS481 family transposase [Antrihabitans cavernicola]|uniref:IS481 family transposase n=1 Tax=Antrihabitans cavernicola TaxID=2495913 RepID=UPI00338FD668